MPRMDQRDEPETRKIGYLGPVGTFTEQAVYSQPDLARMEHRPLGSIFDVLGAVESREVDVGLVAIENMIEGSVTATLDALAFDTELFIQREVIIDVNLNLLVQPGVRIEDIERVRSHPVAYAQCRGHLAERIPGVAFELANSTADAARRWPRRMSAPWLPSPRCAPRRCTDFEVAAGDIADRADNKTRFVLVGADGIAPPTGHDKTSLVVYQQSDVPGSLIGILQEFAARAINLSSLQSRPTKANLGQYCFLLDCEGHIADEVVADALRNLSIKTARVKCLGSYPSASRGEHDRMMNQADTLTAGAWIDELRSRILW